MRYPIGILFVILVSLSAQAANETVLLLEAQRVNEVIYFAPDGKTLKVKVDRAGSFQPLDENTTFKAAKRIDLAFENFNPLEYTVATNETFRDDETAKAVADFLQKVIDTAGDVGVVPAEPVTAENRVQIQASESARVFAINRDLETLEDVIENADPPATACDNYEALHTWLLQLRILMNVPIITRTRFDTWVKAATSADGVEDARGDMETALKELEANAKAIDDVVAAIRKHFSRSLQSPDLALIFQTEDLQSVLERRRTREEFKAKLETDALKTAVDQFGGNPDAAKRLTNRAIALLLENDPTCTEIRASTFAALFDISREAARTEAKKAAVKGDLVALHKSLEKYTDPGDWRETHNFIFLQPKPDVAKIDKITVTLTERIHPKGNIAVALADKDQSSTGSFDLRKYSAVISEIAAALVYTDITYEEFGTGKNALGETIVVPVDDSHFPVEGAMMLNLIPAWWDLSVVYPALQFGVSSTKDAPGFLGGVALRFTGTRQLSVSIGRLVTWHKTLKSLKPGDVITGTADIEADLTLKRAPVAWYGALQYSF